MSATEVDGGAWDISANLTDIDDGRELHLVLHCIDLADVGSIGVGGKYYLDQLVSTMTPAPLPGSSYYFPSQLERFEAQAHC